MSNPSFRSQRGSMTSTAPAGWSTLPSRRRGLPDWQWGQRWSGYAPSVSSWRSTSRCRWLPHFADYFPHFRLKGQVFFGAPEWVKMAWLIFFLADFLFVFEVQKSGVLVCKAIWALGGIFHWCGFDCINFGSLPSLFPCEFVVFLCFLPRPSITSSTLPPRGDTCQVTVFSQTPVSSKQHHQGVISVIWTPSHQHNILEAKFFGEMPRHTSHQSTPGECDWAWTKLVWTKLGGQNDQII